MHAILTKENLLDGTIETQSENFYIEPSLRYSQQLNETGVHSIIYKLSDVDMRKPAAEEPTKSSTAEHCASERLKRSMLLDELKRRKSNGEELRGFREPPLTDNELKMHKKRKKRWLPEEVSRDYVLVSQSFFNFFYDFLLRK